MPLYFQGKWALNYGEQYFAQDEENGSLNIAPRASSIVPMGTFIMYQDDLGGMKTWGYIQLQGNMKFLASTPANNSWSPLVASAADIGSALYFAFVLEDSNPFKGLKEGTDDNVAGVFRVFRDDSWSFYFGYGQDNEFLAGFPEQTLITPGFDDISQTRSCPNGDFSYVVLSELDLRGFQFPGANFNQASLSRTNLSGANLSSATFAGTNLTGATLSSANLSGCDLTTIVHDGSTIVAATKSAPGNFNSARLPFTLINRLWQWLDLRNSIVTGIPSALSSSTSVLQASGAKLSGMNGNDFRGMTLQNAVLNNSLLDGLDLSGADVTGASLIDASLHGTNLTGATLVGANMTGAQLGALAQLFTLPLSTESALNANQVSALTSYFSQNGITLSSTATLQTLAPNRVWELNDSGNHVIYMIRFQTQSGGAQILNVYALTTAASLVNAYMPDAVLAGANLYGVLASNIQFYGSGALIDGSAILEEAQFNDSNLSNVNFTQAELLGTNLSGSHLFNARFNKANLAPSANGVAANLSKANLQGADFTDAQLFGANLANAAVAINVPTKANPQLGGVYLFSLPYTGDSNTVQQYIAELNATSLTKLQAAFQQNDIKLRSQATVAIDTAGQQWLLDNDSENPQNFSTGYVNFLLKVDGGVLDVYGTSLRLKRLGKNNQQEYDTETCNVTILTLPNMNGNTICPNGAMLSVNQKSGGPNSWDTRWLRAATPPKPPTCVPTDFNWCPSTSMTKSTNATS